MTSTRRMKIEIIEKKPYMICQTIVAMLNMRYETSKWFQNWSTFCTQEMGDNKIKTMLWLFFM